MKKKFLSNLLLLLFLNLLIKPFWILGIDRTVQNVVGAQDYGFYFVVFNFSFLFNILLDFGITNFNNRNIARNHHLLNKHFSGIVVIKLLLAVFYTIITFSFGFLIGFNAAQLQLLGFLCFNQFLLSFILYLRSNISGLLLFRTESFLSVLDRILMIIICGILLWGHITTQPFKIEWFVYSQTAAYLLTALTALIIVIKKASFRRLTWNFPFFIIIMKQSFPFAILVMLMAFYNRIDPVMINRLLPGELGESEAGIYASAYRLLDAGNMIAYLFAVLLLPLFSNMLKSRESVTHIVKLSFTLLIIVSVIVSTGSFFYSYELMDLLYTDHVAESAAVFKILMLGFIAVSTTYVFGTLLTANGNLKALNIIAAGGMLANLLINLILVPKLMAVGSAYASLVTQFATAIVQVWFSISIFKFQKDLKYIARLGLFVGGTILINAFSKYAFENWIFNFSLMIVLSTMLALVLKLINVTSLLSILTSSESSEAA
jgi:O-antigen/teichoic acid export membrane protein